MHQDSAYLSPDCQDALQLTAWVPLVDAHYGNGCMQVLDRGHRAGLEVGHEGCPGNTWYIQMREGEERKLGCDMARDVITCEVPAGGILLINNLIPHRSVANTSDGIRWSLDLRWQRPEHPVGFYGLKEGLRLTKSDDPEYKPDWKEWGALDRAELQDRRAKEITESKDEDDTPKIFDTIISGPWMGRWPMTHENKHTQRYKENQEKGGAGTDWHSS